jgi:hypothetical protein
LSESVKRFVRDNIEQNPSVGRFDKASESDGVGEIARMKEYKSNNKLDGNEDGDVDERLSHESQ